jgi:hypothetical protein
VEAVEIGPFDTIMDAMVDADGNPMGHGRPEGLHLGTIIKAIRNLRGGKPFPAGWQDGTTMYAGFLWEWAMEYAFRILGLLRPNTVRQLRLIRDGIHGTLDGVDFETDEPVLEEYKLTWRSQRIFAEEGLGLSASVVKNCPDWLIQIQGYLAMLSTYLERPVTSARLFVFFVMGSYDKGAPAGPRIRVVELRFSEEEIAENWRMIVNVARGWRNDGSEGSSGEVGNR